MCFSHLCSPPRRHLAFCKQTRLPLKHYCRKLLTWGCCVCDSQSKLMREWMLNRQHIDRQHRLRHIIWICNRSLDVTLAYERQEPSQTGLQPRGCLPSLTSHLTFVTVQTRVIYAVTTSMEVCNRRYIYNISFQCLHFVKEKYRGLRLCHWGATATTWSL